MSRCCPIRPKTQKTLLWEFNRASEKLLLEASGQAQVVFSFSFLFSERVLNYISFLELVTAGVGLVVRATGVTGREPLGQATSKATHLPHAGSGILCRATPTPGHALRVQLNYSLSPEAVLKDRTAKFRQASKTFLKIPDDTASRAIKFISVSLQPSLLAE